MSTQEFIDTYTQRIGEVFANRRAMFILWAIKIQFCTTINDFITHYQITPDELAPFLNYFLVYGFLQQDEDHYVLTELGEDTVALLGELSISEFAKPDRLSREVTTRFDPATFMPPSVEATTASYEKTATLFWLGREHDQHKPEATYVELPFLQQLVSLGWQYEGYKEGGLIGVPELTGRASFREVVIEKYLRAALPRVNLDEETGQPWITEFHIQRMLAALNRVLTTHSPSLLQANQAATDLLLKGLYLPLSPESGGRETRRVRFIDFAHPEHNHFLVINQFRVDLAGNRYIVPDLVLFVNGIPLVVVECKSPSLTNPIEQGISQLLRYSGQHDSVSDPDRNQSVPELFYCNLLLISTSFFQARFASLGASYEHFQEWKDPYLPPGCEDYAKLLPAEPSSQQQLILGMLFPRNLLDLFYNFTLFDAPNNRLRKVVARYHQFRAVHQAIERLLHNPTRLQDGDEDRRGGIIWHTQGSGKSLSMVFLVRKMRTIEQLQGFKIIFVTDRKQLENQLRAVAHLTEEPVRTVESIASLRSSRSPLRPEGSRLIFAMIQKYSIKRSPLVAAVDEDQDQDAPATDIDDQPDPSIEPINPEESVLVIVDEAHRSQTRQLHANLRRMLPNSARIAFTGTPVIRGPGKKTSDIFGDYIDKYTIHQSELDGATLPIFYEGHEAYVGIADSQLLNAKYDLLTRQLTHFVRESLQERNVTYRTILENEDLIRRKAEDMLLHYCEHILPNRLKAMVVAVSRVAAILYRNALESAKEQIVARLDALPEDQRQLTMEQIQDLDASEEHKTLLRIFPYRDLLKALDFAAIVSSNPKEDQKDKRVDWRLWSNESLHNGYIENFKKPLPPHLSSSQIYEDALEGKPKEDSPSQAQPSAAREVNSQESSPLAFLCVRSMLITGFDAPIAQGLYLDRSIKNHELLQAIARVNRVQEAKNNGLVVDYFGIAANLKDALDAYNEADVQGAITSIKDEYPLLADRHRRIMALFSERQLDIRDLEGCVKLLKDLEIRADFEIKFKKFMESMETVLPRPQALHYIEDAQHLGAIHRSAASAYRDEELNLINIGEKVRRLIAEHIDTLQIRERIPRLQIHDLYFHRARRYRSNEINAAEMEGFAREYITLTFEQEDPVYCQTLSNRLEEILKRLKDNWDETVEELDKFIQEIIQPRQIDASLQLDGRTEYPFFSILEEEVRKGSRRFEIAPQEMPGRSLNQEERLFLAGVTKEIVQFIRNELRGNKNYWLMTERFNQLRREIGFRYLEEYQLLEPLQRRDEVGRRLVRLALVHTLRLRDA